MRRQPRPPVPRSQDPPAPPVELRRVDGVDALTPDMPTSELAWGCRTDDHWYRAEVTVVQVGMSEPQPWMRFDFRGPGPLDPHNARAGMNMRIGRAGLRVTECILHEIDMMAYDALADREG